MAGNGAFDLASFDGLVEAHEAGIKIDILGPDGEPSGWQITIAGQDSKRAKSFAHQIRKEWRDRKSLTEMGPEEEDEYEVRQLARCTISWTTIQRGGVILECNEKNALMIYSTYPNILRQIRGKVNNDSSFMPRSAASSAELSETSETESAPASQK